MTTHVFIVNEKTFPLHLKYMFAGTGARDLDVEFNDTAENQKVAQNLVGMMADSARIRKGDKIIFIVLENWVKVIFMAYFKQKIDALLIPNPKQHQNCLKNLLFVFY